MFPFTFSRMQLHGDGDYLKFYDLVLTEQVGKFPAGTKFNNALLNIRIGFLSLFDTDVRAQVHIKAHAWNA